LLCIAQFVNIFTADGGEFYRAFGAAAGQAYRLVYVSVPATTNLLFSIQIWRGLRGIVTILPLARYITAAKLISLTTLKALFYLAPAIGFLFGVCLYNKPFTTGHAAIFSLVLFGPLLYTIDVYKVQNMTDDVASAVR